MTETIAWLHALPRERPVERTRFLVAAAEKRRVIHVGFVDHPLLTARIESGDWLHAQLVQVAHHVIGIDIDEEGVEWALQQGFQAHAADATDEKAISALNVEPADLVILGEVIEHVDAPGSLLRAMRLVCKPDGLLIVTTPNALRVMNTVVPFTGRELVHPDHVAWYSPTTLKRLLSMNGWALEQMHYYQDPSDELSGGRRAQKLVANTVRRFASRHASDGLIAVARQG
jgi:SAM-dependent methyltransferase